MTAPRSYTENVLVLSYAVGTSTTAGEGVTLTTDASVDDAAGASDLAVGVALATSATVGEIIDVQMFGWGVIPVAVGTAGATRGTKAQLAADGHVDVGTHDSDGTGNQSSYGVFLQSGTVGQTVGMMLTGAANRGV